MPQIPPVCQEKPIEYFLVKNASINNTDLKRKLFASGLKEEKCEKCGIVDWLGEPLRFELDHINGINNDNRLNNLQILCPNCHSQTPTHSKQKRTTKKPDRF